MVNHTFFLSYAQNRTISPSVRNSNTVNVMGLSYFFLLKHFFVHQTNLLSNCPISRLFKSCTVSQVYTYILNMNVSSLLINGSLHVIHIYVPHQCIWNCFFYSMFILRRHINHSLKWDWFFKFKHNTKCKVNRIDSEKFFEGKRFDDLTMLLYQHSQFHFMDLIWNKTIVRLF